MERFEDLRRAEEKVYVVFANYDGDGVSYLTWEDWGTVDSLLTWDIKKAYTFDSVEEAFSFVRDIWEILEEGFADGEEVRYSLVTESLLEHIR